MFCQNCCLLSRCGSKKMLKLSRLSEEGIDKFNQNLDVFELISNIKGTSERSVINLESIDEDINKNFQTRIIEEIVTN